MTTSKNAWGRASMNCLRFRRDAAHGRDQRDQQERRRGEHVLAERHVHRIEQLDDEQHEQQLVEQSDDARRKHAPATLCPLP